MTKSSAATTSIAPAPESPRIANAALLLTSLALTFALLEVAARLLFPAPLPWKYPQLRYRPDPTLIFAWQPDQTGFSADKEISINARGLRGPLVPYERTPGVKRILFLGDSITFGYGVTDDEMVSERVRALLADAGIRAESVNAAVSSYNTEQEVAFYENEGHRYDPDLVVVGVCWNDINDKSAVRVDTNGDLVDADHDAPSAAASASATEYELRNVLKRSRLLYGTLERWRAYQANSHPDEHTTFRSDVLSGHLTPKVTDGWTNLEEAFRRLHVRVRSEGRRLLVVAFPIPLMLERPFPDSSYPSRLASFAAHEDIPFLDLTDAYRVAFRGHESLFIPFDADHPNAAGHEVAAHAVVTVVQPWMS